MEKKINSDTLNILRKINQSPKTSQRKLAKDLNLSLGKLNYLLKALRAKGLVKIKILVSKRINLNTFNTLLLQKVYPLEQSLP